jgi:hypothetical protein
MMEYEVKWNGARDGANRGYLLTRAEPTRSAPLLKKPALAVTVTPKPPRHQGLSALSLAKQARVLAALRQQPHTVTELSNRAGVSVHMVARVLRLCKARGELHQDRARGGYFQRTAMRYWLDPCTRY